MKRRCLGALAALIDFGTAFYQRLYRHGTAKAYCMMQWGHTILIRFTNVSAAVQQREDSLSLVLGVTVALNANG
ncbi:hypothetical protein N9039_02415 [Verrucomicrobiales bacterium]|jgi:hypothetical protein|nr:hypothetical protein [Verrucomicrobiales bacterium]